VRKKEIAMCFSAGASFTASALLALAGSVALSKIKRHQEYMIAFIPMLFAFQQFIEGVLWLSFTNDSYKSLYSFALYGFLLFAFVVWPLWIPISLYEFYKNSVYSQRLRFPIIVGIIVALSLLAYLMVKGATASVHGHHILYDVPVSFVPSMLVSIAYLCATLVPFFMVRSPKINLFGLTLLFSYLISAWFYTQVSISVWCFFAALLSIMVFLII
jgi:hypothetical protein